MKRRPVMLMLVAGIAALMITSTGGCEVAARLGVFPTATATRTSTPTLTPTATATATPTQTPTPTRVPLSLSVEWSPQEVKQGHTLSLVVQANRPVSVTGTLDESRLYFTCGGEKAWALIGIPVAEKVEAHPIRLLVSDGLGSSVSTTLSVTVLSGAFASEVIDVPDDRIGLLAPEVSQEDASYLDRVFGVFTEEQLWRGLFLRPYEGRVSSAFGTRRVYTGGVSSFHGGLDLAGVEGATVVAANSGRVALTGLLQLHGNTIVLDHGLGVYSAYYHLSKIEVRQGQMVSKGEKIGLLGNTGLSTGPHLHWEMRILRVPVDPVEWTERVIPE